MRIYMAGAGGMLGHAFQRQFSGDCVLRCTDIDVNEHWLEYLDFRDFKAYADDVEAFNPDLLFHLGAHTSLEQCEQDAADSYLTNTMSVENATVIANRLKIPLLYISTAGIFDGKKETYDDWDAPNPLGVYARTKYLGERYVVENAERYFVCRAGWMMGAGPAKDKKFVQKMMAQLKAGASVLNVVNDKDGTPTYTHDFARTVKRLVGTQFYGVYNMVCQGQTSRFEVAEEILRLTGRSETVRLNPVSSEFFSKEYFAARPASERLINAKLEMRGISEMRDWRTSLAEYLAEAYSDYLPPIA